MILLIILIMSLTGICGFSGYMLHRNEKVFKLRNDLAAMCYDYVLEHLHEKPTAHQWAYNQLPSYKSMVYSLKNVELESWLSPDIITRLKEGIKNNHAQPFHLSRPTT